MGWYLPSHLLTLDIFLMSNNKTSIQMPKKPEKKASKAKSEKKPKAEVKKDPAPTSTKVITVVPA